MRSLYDVLNEDFVLNSPALGIVTDVVVENMIDNREPAIAAAVSQLKHALLPAPKYQKGTPKRTSMAEAMNSAVKITTGSVLVFLQVWKTCTKHLHYSGYCGSATRVLCFAGKLIPR